MPCIEPSVDPVFYIAPERKRWAVDFLQRLLEVNKSIGSNQIRELTFVTCFEGLHRTWRKSKPVYPVNSYIYAEFRKLAHRYNDHDVGVYIPDTASPVIPCRRIDLFARASYPPEVELVLQCAS